MTRAGALDRLATGYYAVVPDDRAGHDWRPELEAAALGIAAADEGVDTVALMGLSAARVRGAIPPKIAPLPELDAIARVVDQLPSRCDQILSV